MGILNATPNSFYDGGYYSDEKELLAQAERLVSEGADIIDIGGYSTKPNCEPVSEEEELKRVVPLVKALAQRFPDIAVSVDTFRAKVAEESIMAGATIINDISGAHFEERIIDVVAQHPKVQYVLMHCAETLETMHRINHRDEDIVMVVKDFFVNKLAVLQERGIEKGRIILDPGLGFGKTMRQNFQLLRYLDTFVNMGAVLVGLSRKSMVYKTLNITPQEALAGTIALDTIALMNGARYIRVHDVKEAKETVTLFSAYQDSEQ